jgi:hypothetical protein
MLPEIAPQNSNRIPDGTLKKTQKVSARVNPPIGAPESLQAQ